MPLSNYLAVLIRNHLLRDATYSKTTARWVALCTSSPSASSTGSTIAEPSDANYVRIQVDADDDNWANGTAGATDNVAAITWPAADSGFTVTHFAVCDASTAGNMLFYGSLGGSVVVDACEVAKINIGALDFAIS